MNLCHSPDSALKLVHRWFGALPLLSADLLFRALEARTGDYPEFPAILLAHLCQRIWLFPPQSIEEREKWTMRVFARGGKIAFWQEVAQWAESQRSQRTYEITNGMIGCARTAIEQATLDELRALLHQWGNSHGVIAFLRSEGGNSQVPPTDDMLLPFCLMEHDMGHQEADFGFASATRAMAQMGAGPAYTKKLRLCFPTMGKLPSWMIGESGALAIWFALLARARSLPCLPLDIGLAGCLDRTCMSLDYSANPGHIVSRKRDLFLRACVRPVVLPDTMGVTHSRRSDHIAWPHSIPLGVRMKALMESQQTQYPDAGILRRAEACLIDGMEDDDLMDIRNLLSDLETRERICTQTARQINLLSFICCCRLQDEPGATLREGQLLNTPINSIDDVAFLVRRAANLADGLAKTRMLTVAELLKQKQSQMKQSDNFSYEFLSNTILNEGRAEQGDVR